MRSSRAGSGAAIQLVDGRCRFVDLSEQGIAGRSPTISRWRSPCDDSGATEQARICRDRAAEMLSSALAWGDIASENVVVHGVLADLLRRAGRYDDAVAACATGEAALDLNDDGDAPTPTVLAFIRCSRLGACPVR